MEAIRTILSPAAIRRLLLAATVLLCGYALLRTAWLTDDAYITYRAVENFVTGFGLRWNPDERVQAFTHALWFFVVSAGRALSGEIYYTVYAISITLSLAAMALVVYRLAATAEAGLFALVAILSSRAVIDYSTSGLENPLTNLLFAAFLIVFDRGHDKPTPRRLGLLVLCSALMLTNRLDSGLLTLPVVFVETWRIRRQAIIPVIAGVLPFAAWEIFSVVYFGFPFPNTVYAKLPPNLTLAEFVPQGVAYLKDSLANDPVTLPIVVAGILVPVAARRWRDLPLAIGLVLSLLFLVRVGGDFMSGRFLNTPCLAAIAVLSRYAVPRSRGLSFVPAAAVLVVGCFTPFPPLLSNGSFDGRSESSAGITDERSYYYQNAGLLRDKNTGKPLVTRREQHVERALARGLYVTSTTAIGYAGYFAGRRLHIVDPVGLADPLIARLPTERPWRIGHFQRPEVRGYSETLLTGTNQIEDPGVAAFYDKIALITRGPIWSPDRWRAILEMNAGSCRYLIDSYSRGYRGFRASAAAGFVPAEAAKDPSPYVNFELGLTLFLAAPSRMTRVSFTLDTVQDYTVVYLLKGRELATATLPVPAGTNGKFAERLQDVPVSAGEVDEIRIVRVGSKMGQLERWRVIG